MTDKDTNRKQKVLHTRVSADLEKDLKTKATHLGISVSNLVRNALLNTVDLVETVVADGARVAGSAKNLTDTTAAPIEEPGTVVGWQEVTVNLNAICSQCNTILPRGEKAVIALPTSEKNVQARCLGCLPPPPPAKGAEEAA